MHHVNGYESDEDVVELAEIYRMIQISIMYSGGFGMADPPRVMLAA